MYTCQNDEGEHADLVKCCRGTYLSVGMLKGHMARERLRTPGLDSPQFEWLLCCIWFLFWCIYERLYVKIFGPLMMHFWKSRQVLII